MKPVEFGSYLLLERLNTGGMAEIHAAKSFGAEGFGRVLAIKKLLPKVAADEQVVGMFVDEAHIAVMLSHPNIVQTYELGEVRGQYYIAMELVAGKDLRQLQNELRKTRQLMSVSAAAYVITRVCEALDYAHNKLGPDGRPMLLVHRDISPQNVLISYDGAVKLTDFGIAKATHRSTETQVGMFKGKIGYLSPEQIAGLPLDRRSDLFNVGILLYELLTGARPFDADSDLDSLTANREAIFPDPLRLNPSLPESMRNIIGRLLERDPERRYQQAAEVTDALEPLLFEQGRLFTAKRLAALMEAHFAETITDSEQRMNAYMAIQPPASLVHRDTADSTGPTAEKRARQALSELYDSLAESSPSGSVLAFYPVRIYLGMTDYVDATSTRLSSTHIEMTLTRLLDMGSSVDLWLQLPGLVSGITMVGEVESVVPAGAQGIATVRLHFSSVNEQQTYMRYLENLAPA